MYFNKWRISRNQYVYNLRLGTVSVLRDYLSRW